MKRKYTKGFTLIELLVVIAIVAILAAALFLVINPAALLAKSRDSRRVSELGELNKAIAATFANSTTFALTDVAVTNSCGAGKNDSGGTGYVTYVGSGVGGSVPANALRVFMPALPVDPKNGDLAYTGVNFCYYFAASGNTWEINALLEADTSVSTGNNDGGNDNTCATGSANMLQADCRYEVGTAPGLTLL